MANKKDSKEAATHLTEVEQRRKALESTLSSIEKDFGKGTVNFTINMCNMLLNKHGVKRIGEQRVVEFTDKGVKTMALTDKTGSLVGLHAVQDDEDLMLITKSGTAIRMAMDSIRVQGRATQGVKLIELQKRNDVLMFGCVVPKEEEEQNDDTALNGENGEPSETPENVEQNNE